MLNYELFDDEELQRLAVSGDELAEEQLTIRYMKVVEICSRPYFLIGGERKDLIQEGNVGLVSAIREYKPGVAASFRTFAKTCIKNSIISAIRKAASESNLAFSNCVSLDSLSELTTEESYISLLASGLSLKSPEEQVIASESEINSIELYSSFKDALSELEATVLDLYLKELSYQEIGEITGKSPKAVDNAIQRIRRKLAQILNSGDFSKS